MSYYEAPDAGERAAKRTPQCFILVPRGSYKPPKNQANNSRNQHDDEWLSSQPEGFSHGPPVYDQHVAGMPYCPVFCLTDDIIALQSKEGRQVMKSSALNIDDVVNDTSEILGFEVSIHHQSLTTPSKEAQCVKAVEITVDQANAMCCWSASVDWHDQGWGNNCGIIGIDGVAKSLFLGEKAPHHRGQRDGCGDIPPSLGDVLFHQSRGTESCFGCNPVTLKVNVVVGAARGSEVHIDHLTIRFYTKTFIEKEFGKVQPMEELVKIKPLSLWNKEEIYGEGKDIGGNGMLVFISPQKRKKDEDEDGGMKRFDRTMNAASWCVGQAGFSIEVKDFSPNYNDREVAKRTLKVPLACVDMSVAQANSLVGWTMSQCRYTRGTGASSTMPMFPKIYFDGGKKIINQVDDEAVEDMHDYALDNDHQWDRYCYVPKKDKNLQKGNKKIIEVLDQVGSIPPKFGDHLLQIKKPSLEAKEKRERSGRNVVLEDCQAEDRVRLFFYCEDDYGFYEYFRISFFHRGGLVSPAFHFLFTFRKVRALSLQQVQQLEESLIAKANGTVVGEEEQKKPKYVFGNSPSGAGELMTAKEKEKLKADAALLSFIKYFADHITADDILFEIISFLTFSPVVACTVGLPPDPREEDQEGGGGKKKVPLTFAQIVHRSQMKYLGYSSRKEDKERGEAKS